MSDRKATFAKRQRESELKEKAKLKEERRVSRRSQPRENKGPEIAWDEAVNITTNPIDNGGPAAVTEQAAANDDDGPAPTPPPPTTPSPTPRR
jgi:hypothetical protein